MKFACLPSGKSRRSRDACSSSEARTHGARAVGRSHFGRRRRYGRRRPRAGVSCRARSIGFAAGGPGRRRATPTSWGRGCSTGWARPLAAPARRRASPLDAGGSIGVGEPGDVNHATGRGRGSPGRPPHRRPIGATAPSAPAGDAEAAPFGAGEQCGQGRDAQAGDGQRQSTAPDRTADRRRTTIVMASCRPLPVQESSVSLRSTEGAEPWPRRLQHRPNIHKAPGKPRCDQTTGGVGARRLAPTRLSATGRAHGPARPRRLSRRPCRS